MTRVPAVSCLAVVLAGLAACNDSAGTDPSTLVPTAVAVEGSSGQSALRGTLLLRPLQVKVEYRGRPKAGVAVTWEPSAGSILVSSSFTDSVGIAKASWILGTVPGEMTVAASVEGVPGPPVIFTATALPLMALAADPTTDGQTGVVGKALDRPLRVRVLSEGWPSPGVTVRWQSMTGVDSSVTDVDGYAVAAPILDTLPGTKTISASAAGVTGTAIFTVTAIPGPAMAIGKEYGDSQTVPANYPQFAVVRIVVADRYGNAVPGQAIDWTVVSGPGALLSATGTTDPSGRASALYTPTGTPGAISVRASIPGGQHAADFSLTAGPRVWVVLWEDYTFVSGQNGSQPAVDTVAVGTTVKWYLSPYYFDYDSHGVSPVGDPSFPGADFSGNPSEVNLTFTQPGTYHYADPYYPRVTGTLVVQ
jgi:plastocyanin